MRLFSADNAFRGIRPRVGGPQVASLLLLIPLGLALLAVSIWAFLWAADHDQFDDLETPALRVLEEDATIGTEDSLHGSKP